MNTSPIPQVTSPQTILILDKNNLDNSNWPIFFASEKNLACFNTERPTKTPPRHNLHQSSYWAFPSTCEYMDANSPVIPSYNWGDDFIGFKNGVLFISCTTIEAIGISTRSVLHIPTGEKAFAQKKRRKRTPRRCAITIQQRLWTSARMVKVSLVIFPQKKI